MTINERIKKLRKEKNLSQKKFAASIGVTQSGVSYMEQNGSTVSDSVIKTICSVYTLNESWLRTGAEPMSIKLDTFSLDQYAKERGASELELAIAKAYFDLPQNVRTEMLAKLKSLLNGEAESAAETASESPPDDLEGLTTDELEAMEDKQYKKRASGSA